MCEPVTMAVLGATFAAESAKTQEKMASRSASSALRSGRIQQNTIRKRQIQEARAAGLKKQEVRDAAQRAQSVNQVATGEAGIGGRTVKALARDIRRRELAGIAAVDRNEDAVQEQLALEAQGANAATARSISAINPGPGAGIAATEGGLRGISQGLGNLNAVSARDRKD
ncbi:MAG: hypothetical protein NXI30_04070 [bacterium]|nr:hypothetical protein [bacterium]